MKVKQSNVLTASGTVTTTLNMNETGFLPGMQVPVFYHSPTGSFVGSANLQTSIDNLNWNNAIGSSTITAAGPIHNITLQQYMRLFAGTVTSGSIQVTFMSDI